MDPVDSTNTTMDEITERTDNMDMGSVANSTSASIANETDQDEDIVDPWKVTSKSAKGVDYDKLISKFKEHG